MNFLKRLWWTWGVISMIALIETVVTYQSSWGDSLLDRFGGFFLVTAVAYICGAASRDFWWKSSSN